MDYGEIDFRTFAHLRGRQAKPSLKWGILISGILFLVGFFLLLNEVSWTALGF